MPDASTAPPAEPVSEPSAEPPPDIAGTLMSPKVLRALTQPSGTFNRAALLEAIFRRWGKEKGIDGQEAFAQAIFGEFDAAKAGSVVRQRIVDMVTRLINWHSDDVHAVPVEEMTEQELVDSIRAALPQLGVIANAPDPEPEPEPVPTPQPDPVPELESYGEPEN